MIEIQSDKIVAYLWFTVGRNRSIRRKPTCPTWSPHTIRRTDPGDRTRAAMVTGQVLDLPASRTDQTTIIFIEIQLQFSSNSQQLNYNTNQTNLTTIYKH